MLITQIGNQFHSGLIMVKIKDQKKNGLKVLIIWVKNK